MAAIGTSTWKENWVCPDRRRLSTASWRTKSVGRLGKGKGAGAGGTFPKRKGWELWLAKSALRDQERDGLGGQGPGSFHQPPCLLLTERCREQSGSQTAHRGFSYRGEAGRVQVYPAPYSRRTLTPLPGSGGLRKKWQQHPVLWPSARLTHRPVEKPQPR